MTPQPPIQRRSGLQTTLVLGVTLAAALGCSGLMDSPEAASNRAACQAWVDHMNGLECNLLTYDRSEMCQGADASPADMARYFDCVREHSRCDGGALISDVTDCQQPMM